MKYLFPLTSFLLLLVSAYLLLQLLDTEGRLSSEVARSGNLTKDLESARGDAAQLNKSLQEKSSALANLGLQLQNTGSELNSTKAELAKRNQELQDTKAQLNRTSGLLNITKTEILGLKSELLELEDSIQASIQWFRDNSFIPPSLDPFSRRSYSRCYEGDELNLGCIPYVMEDRLDFVYRNEYPDRLLSIEEMVGKEGGDCEDYSLFLKAYLNSFEDERAELVAWEPEPGSQFIIYTKDEQYWYYEGDAVELGRLSDLDPLVICYTTYYSDFRKEGHCIVGLSWTPVDSADDLRYLDGSHTFEPQNGRYEGRIGQEFHICQEGEFLCESDLNSIFFVISDDDLYQFSDGTWRSYEQYGVTVSQVDDRMDSLLETLR